MAEQVPYGYQSLPRKEEQVDGKLSIYNKIRMDEYERDLTWERERTPLSDAV
jgi:hypothetical protein